MTKSMKEQLTKYLTDAHSIEEQSLAQLRHVPDMAGHDEFARALREHLSETEGHEDRVRGLLEERGAKPSRVKDAVMHAGGWGFVLFAKSQPDTPGKLASHALSYEALEWASYDLLARTAERGGEPEVAAVARSIRDEERAMMDRIEGLLDETAEASVAGKSDEELVDALGTYLADAHAIEAQSIQLLEAGQEMVKGYPTLEALFAEHLEESRTQQQVIEQRMDIMGVGRSLLKDAVMRFGALNWGTFFLGHPDTPGKLAGFAYAFEHLEIGGYEQLRRVAERAGQVETADAVRRILEQERETAATLANAFGEAVGAALEEQDVE